MSARRLVLWESAARSWSSRRQPKVGLVLSVVFSCVDGAHTLSCCSSESDSGALDEVDFDEPMEVDPAVREEAEAAPGASAAAQKEPAVEPQDPVLM